jgi:hypothetical protein
MRAAQLFASGQFNEARLLLQSVIEVCPTDVDAWPQSRRSSVRVATRKRQHTG